MINEFDFYHGAALCKLVHNNRINTIITFPTSSNSSYVANENIGIYIKYSTKRLSPWRFTFAREHQDEINDMKEILGKVYVLLVCYKDGIACLDFDELKAVLNYEHEQTEWISVSRRHREKYSVKGSDGKLRLKIGVSELNKII